MTTIELFFDIVFDHPFTASKVITNTGQSDPAAVALTFDTTQNQAIQAKERLEVTLETITAARVTVHGDPAVQAFDPTVVAAKDVDWAEEYLSLDLAVAIVSTLEEALEHIRKWGSAHTEAIITRLRPT